MSDQRQDNLDRIRRDGSFDAIVIGGGINGIGVYRELALQGLRVLLVERNDFCSGCSAAPSSNATTSAPDAAQRPRA